MNDREIDAEIAEHLFGWQWEVGVGRKILRAHAGDCAGVIYDGEESITDGLPHYTTDARDCALVKAELRRRGWYYFIEYIPQADESKRYHIEIMAPATEFPYGTRYNALADTEERAVALAARRAVGVEG
jgi:hypothetical protein